MKRYVGLDVHSKSSTFVIQDFAGAIKARGSLPTTAEGFKRLRDQHFLEPDTQVALESGTVAFYAAEQLANLGLTPLVIDAREVRAKASRPLQKSDSRDALELCEGLRRGIYRSIVWVPPTALREFRETLSRRRHFVRLKTSQVNAVKRILRSVGQGDLAKRLQYLSNWDKLVQKLEEQPRLQEFVRCHQAMWLCAHEQAEFLEKNLKELSRPWKETIDRLRTVPGVGPIVACTTVAVLADVRRFPSAKQVASYAGLVPSTNQSGTRDHHGHITRRGSSELRSMLCEAAQHSRRPDHPLHAHFQRICFKRGYKMAIVTVAHRLSRILFAMLRDGTEFSTASVETEVVTV
jgi:transposase